MILIYWCIVYQYTFTMHRCNIYLYTIDHVFSIYTSGIKRMQCCHFGNPRLHIILELELQIHTWVFPSWCWSCFLTYNHHLRNATSDRQVLLIGALPNSRHFRMAYSVIEQAATQLSSLFWTFTTSDKMCSKPVAFCHYN